MPQRVDRRARVVERPQTGGLQPVEAPRSPAADGRAGSQARSQQSLVLEPFERGVDGAGGNVAFETRLNFLQDRSPVRVVSEADDGEQYCLFESPEHVGHTCLHCRNNQAVVNYFSSPADRRLTLRSQKIVEMDAAAQSSTRVGRMPR